MVYCVSTISYNGLSVYIHRIDISIAYVGATAPLKPASLQLTLLILLVDMLKTNIINTSSAYSYV